jgi:hypothetical protein
LGTFFRIAVVDGLPKCKPISHLMMLAGMVQHESQRRSFLESGILHP